MKDNRSEYFVFVPFCLLAQAYQAQGIVKYEWKASIKPFMELLIENNINIIFDSFFIFIGFIKLIIPKINKRLYMQLPTIFPTTKL